MAKTDYTINEIDIGNNLVDKSYIEQVYPDLVDVMKIDGRRLWLWGNNDFGRLGTNDVTHRSSPVQTVSGGIVWRQIATMGRSSHTAAIKTDGTLWTWGNNANGRLGTNNITHRSSPVQTVSGGNNWRQVSTGEAYTTAIKTDGTLWLWGLNSSGQLGTNNITSRSSPVQTVSSGTNWQQVSAGVIHTAAIKTDGTLWMWGANSLGRLGTNDITHRSSPVQTVSSGTDWRQVSAGGYHTAAIKTDGTLWIWGFNTSGQLGTNDITHRSSPVQTVSGGTDWRQVSAGVSHTTAIKTDGTLWIWGVNTSGQLGINDITHRSSPVQTVSGGNNWRQVSAGSAHIGAIKTDGTLWMWGSNTNGQLGTNDTTNRSSPVQTVMGGGYWQQISAGNTHTVGIYNGAPEP